MMKKSKILWGLLVLLIASVLVVSVVYHRRYALWHRKPSICKTVAAYCIASSIRGLDKQTAASKLGRPDRESDRYALLVLRDSSWSSGMTADLVAQVNSENQITNITYAWKDFVPTKTDRYDQQIWMQSGIESKIAMSSDLILRWRSGELQHQLRSLPKFEEYLGKVIFVDEWRYLIGDWTALVVNFGQDGKVANAYIGNDD